MKLKGPRGSFRAAAAEHVSMLGAQTSSPKVFNPLFRSDSKNTGSVFHIAVLCDMVPLCSANLPAFQK